MTDLKTELRIHVRHFEQELDQLKAKLLEMSALVESAVYRSVQGVVEKNEELAQQVLKNEARINQLEIEIDDMAIGLLALQAPHGVRLAPGHCRHQDQQRSGAHGRSFGQHRAKRAGA